MKKSVKFPPFLENLSVNFFDQLFAGTKGSNVNANANNEANNGPSHHRRRRRHLIRPEGWYKNIFS
jgi:hypothetical protein